MARQLEYANEPIAIVGSACRFPGDATSPSKLWDLLQKPRDVISDIPPSRFNVDGFYHPDALHHGATNVRQSYFIKDDHRAFDAQFFGIKPIEANSIDPQQRLLMETTYEALEAAGIPMEKVQGTNTGVYVGLMTGDYADLLGRDIDNFPTYFASGTARSIMSNRISYFFDLNGPSMTIDTACSSSLYAIHLAAQSLRSGESSSSIVAGSNLLLGPEQYVAESKLKMLSPNSRSRMWDKDADGYARGDGVAVLVLKTLRQAIADNDNIECIVRETGINQDGRTKGITMPNPMAQKELIKHTYQKAGLDLRKQSDRPQYFEAHGTGTPAGDPTEAEAISTSFFGPELGFSRAASADPLYVGSIKTVVGHTEGTAGIAGVMKASLALQNSQIPPNMLFNELSPSVRPFYNDLCILKEAKEWPGGPTNDLRRASVNSFGFGGANAHAILENYLPDTKELAQQETDSTLSIAPFNFSAGTEKSLKRLLASYASYFDTNPSVNLRDLSWTLNTRRSTLPSRISLAAASTEALSTKLKEASETANGVLTVSGSQTADGSARLLGIFTGQGAQWATMGADLLKDCNIFSDCIDSLQTALDSLPAEHRPAWTIREELLKDKTTSRIGEAELSQPLCTAVQVGLVSILQAAKVELAAVVGHSSGEIAAAFAAGYLSAEDAIRIAYYRGYFLKLSGSENGSQGAMMAIGTSHEDAEELCELPSLEGRLCIAARNSPSSLTLSGDADAISEAKEILDDEKKFARLLKVDKAYHSPHMKPCFEPYVAALKACDVKVLPRSNGQKLPVWVSSVTGEHIESLDLATLSGKYWGDNMCQPVLFSQAVEFALGAEGPFDMGIEIGPHPALKGPATSTTKAIAGLDLPYTGTLARGTSGTEAIALSLGSLWQSLGASVVDFTALDSVTFSTCRAPRLLKGLPTYSWDHDRTYWHESRYSKAFRGRKEQPHDLLGMKCPDGIEQEIRFKNHLSVKEIPWLVHHQIQGQIVFPAAGYVSTVVEAIANLFAERPVQLLEFENLVIGQALILNESTGVDTILTIKILEQNASFQLATFGFYSDSGKESGAMVKNASGAIRVITGPSSEDSLPSPNPCEGRFQELEWERFYLTTAQLGFGYTGPFKSLSNTRRRLGEATGTLGVPSLEDSPGSPLIIHPATLDCAIQSIILAFSYPGDGRLRSIYLPTVIDRLRINMASCQESTERPGTQLPFYASMSNDGLSDLSGDVEIHSADGKSTIIQLEGLHATPLEPPSASNDVKIFTELAWGPETPPGTNVTWEGEEFADDLNLSFMMEKVAYFYLRQIGTEFPKTSRKGYEWHHARLFDYVDHCLEYVASGTHPYAKKEWINDSRDDILKIVDNHPSSIDLRIMKAVGENLPRAIKGEMNILEAMMHENMLNDFYAYALGMNTYLEDMARIVGQYSHRFPHMNILEIGSGTGGATELIFKGLNGAFASYTYTDISSGFFEKAQEKFAAHESQMIYKVCDIEKSPADQGFTEGSYDLIVASLVLHATRNLEETMRNARKLLKPGGYLLMVELTDNDPMRFGFIFGGLPGWWLGYDDGRKLSPCVSAEAWNDLMLKTGFTGIDSHTPHNRSFPLPLAVISCQANDERISFLRDPLTQGHSLPKANDLTIVGGEKKMAEALQSIVKTYYKKIDLIQSIDWIASNDLPFSGTVISLEDTAIKSVFEEMSATRLTALQKMIQQSKNLVWVTMGAQSENPYKNMFVGLQRSVTLELTHVRHQIIDLEQPFEHAIKMIAVRLLQLEAYGIWEEKNQLKNLLWHNEPEVSIKNGQILIPRYRLTCSRNDRYNAGRRAIFSEANENTVLFSIKNQGSNLILEKRNEVDGRFDGTELLYSLLEPVRMTDNTTVFVSLGKDLSTDSVSILLSGSLDSVVRVPASWKIPVPDSLENGRKALVLLHYQLLARSILRETKAGSKVAILKPEAVLGNYLAAVAKDIGVELVLLTGEKRCSIAPWVYLHPRATTSSIRKLLPPDISTFIFWKDQTETLATIKNCLPEACAVVEYTQVGNMPMHLDLSPLGIREVSDLLQNAWIKGYENSITVDHDMTKVVGLSDISRHDLVLRQTMASWQTENSVQIPVQPASKQVKFTAGRTYWLVGLTGGLGLSLCEWMSERGATHIALSSRNPKIEGAWIQDMANIGCTVRVFANDVTQKESLHEVHRKILASMPTIAGVAQGAMVLHDTLFPDLDLERFEKVVKPKVLGSVYLDEMFNYKGLEFFLYFSSMAYITGNPGQSAYSAANAFMASQAAQRRKRGLVGSVMNIGAIMGNGYVSRELTLGQQSFLHKVGHSWMSEQDFHEIFAEGVLAARPGCSDPAEMSTGLRIDDGESRDWASNPMFQHLIRKHSAVAGGQSKGKSGTAIKPQLLEANTEAEVFEILKEGFLIKLQLALQADPDKPMLDVSPDELGVDSLVAVDIQSWFRKELNIDVPVLMVLNAISVNELLVSAQELLAPELIPNVGGREGATTTQSPNSVSNPAPVIEAQRTNNEESKETAQLSSSNSSNDAPSTPTSESGSNTFATHITTPMEASTPQSKKAANASAFGDVHASGFERNVPMSFAQSRFWFLNFFVEQKTAFNVTSIVRLKGKIDVERFDKALQAVGQRHEAIRTVFYTDENTKRHMQGVLAKSILKLDYRAAADKRDIDEAVGEMKNHVFDLGRGESLRLKLISTSDEEHCLILGYHHIAVDGIGFPIFFADLEKAYEGSLDLSGAGMLQYPDFARRQANEYQSGAWSKQLAYWRDQFPNLPEPLPLLPLSERSWRPESSSFESHLVDFRMDKALKLQIEQCCRRFRVTPYHFYLAVFRVLLYRYANGVEDLCVGVTDGNRKDADVLQSLGLFLNLVPLRFRQDSHQTFADCLKDVKAVSDNGFANSRVPFDLLLTELQVPRSPSYSPLFQALLNYRQNIVEARAFCGCESDGELISAGQNAYDISVDIVDVSSGDNHVVFAVNKQLYSEDHAQILMRSYLSLLQGFSKNPATRIVWPALHLDEDIRKAIRLGKGPELVSRWPSTIVDRIDDMVAAYGKRTALTDGFEAAYTYDQMSRRANKLASILFEKGARRGSCVGVLQSPGPNWVCSLLAILRTGAAYVAFDTQVTSERLSLIAQDCKPKVIFVDKVTQKESDFLINTDIEVINISDIDLTDEVPWVKNQAQILDTAVIAYTSGTTGVPKGVIQTHSGYKNFLEFSVPTWGIQEGQEILLQQSSYAFDMSLGQILVSLTYGGTLVIPQRSLRNDPAAICDLLVSSNVTFTMGTPTEFVAWINHGGKNSLSSSKWRGTMSGGEAMTESLVLAFKSLEKPDFTLVNSYGPAETTCGCADGLLSLRGTGRQLMAVSTNPNYSICIVDEKRNPVPVGIPGEVVIGGAGVARGYLNQDQATSSAFISDKYTSPFFNEHGWSKAHASGDRGHLDAKGRLILQGRIEGSTQIKLGGIRMDLEDIESTIIQSMGPHISQAIVSLRQSPNSEAKYLVAFVELSKSLLLPNENEFLDQLPSKLPLPQYMRPAIAVAIDALPMTSSNKIDRSAVDKLQIPESSYRHNESSQSDEDQVDETIASLWKEVLPHDVLQYHGLTKNSDFFHVGGSSLTLVSLQTLIRDRLDISVTLASLFQAITLGEMSELIRNQGLEENRTEVDWEKEVEISQTIVDEHSATIAARPLATPSIIAVTGTTGFVGKELLRQLVADETIAKVHCLAVRRPKQMLPQLFYHEKIVIHDGDLGVERLGLDEQTAEVVFDEVDAVVHIGADVSFMKTYHSLRLVNVASTKELIRLSLPRRIPFHFISSASVARLSGLESFGQVSVEQYPPNLEVDDGYTAAKWVSEVYTERISKRFGLPAVIHRPSSVTGDDAPESDLMSNMMKYSREIKAVPNSSDWKGQFDFVSVQTLTRTIMREIMRQAKEGERSGHKIVYESGEIEIGIDEVQSLMEMSTGEHFEVLSADEWVDKAERAGMNPILTLYLRRAAGGQVLFPKLIKN